MRAFEYFGGVTQVIVIDNLRSGVARACRYEPDLNPSYQDFAAHYGVAVLPARVRKPRDKAKAEVAVQGIERWILAPLRHCTFFSLAELNACCAAIWMRVRDDQGEIDERSHLSMPVLIDAGKGYFSG